VSYSDVLTRRYAGKAWSISNDDYDTLVWSDTSPKPTREQLDALVADVDYEKKYEAVELERRARYQAETDGLFFAAQREGGDLAAWQQAVDAIKAELPYPVR